MGQKEVDDAAERILLRERAVVLRKIVRLEVDIDRVYRKRLDRLKKQLAGKGPLTAKIRREMRLLSEELRPSVERMIRAGAISGSDAAKAQFLQVFEAGEVPAIRFPKSAEALAAAGARIRGQTTVDRVRLSRRLWRANIQRGDEMAAQIQATIRAGKSMTEIADEIIGLDPTGAFAKKPPRITMPRYVERLRDAARKAAAQGQPNLYDDAVTKFSGQIEKLGQAPSGFANSVRPAAKHLVKQLKDATPVQINKHVDRFMLDKARVHARMIARTETIEAYRDSYIKSTKDQEFVKGYRRRLGARHPEPDECMPAGTLIETDSGPVPIEEIRSGDLVLTHRGRYRPVLATMSKAREAIPLYDLVYSQALGTSPPLRVSLTGNHPVLTDRGWIPAASLRTGDVGLHLSQRMRRHLPSCDRRHKGERCSRRNSPEARGHQSIVSGLCDAFPNARRRTIHMIQTWLAPMTALASPRLAHVSSWYRLASFHFPRPFLSARNIEESKTFRATHERTSFRTSHTDASSGGVRTYSNPSSNRGVHRRSPIASANLFLHTQGTVAQTARRASILSRIYMSNIAAWFGDVFRQLRKPSAPLGCRRSGRLVTLSSVAFSTTARVYNLNVAGDQSYTANGLAVHNCDTLAGQDLYGLGPGGYPVDSVPVNPHPLDLCITTAIVDRDHFKREIAKRRKVKQPPKPWLSGKKETSADWYRKQPAAVREKILGPTRAEVFRTDPDAVLGKDGVPRRVKDVLKRTNQ